MQPSDTIDDPVAAARPVLHALAAEHCDGCAWYHGTRLDFRALGLDFAKAPAEQAELFRVPLGPLAATGDFPHVLLSGTGDYAMAAVVAAIYAAADARLDLTVIDRCETPLRIVAWWAERSGRAVNTHKGAITSYVPDEVFDLVCTDAFLGLFDADARVGVVRRWRDALRPGGKAVTTFRVRRRREGADARAARREETARTAAARAAADPSLGLDAGEAAQSVRTYFERHKTHAIASVAEIERLFVDSGFAVDAIAGPRPAGDPMPGYVTLTATRR